MSRGSPAFNMQMMIMWGTLVYPALSLLVPQRLATCEDWAYYQDYQTKSTCQDYQTKNNCPAKGDPSYGQYWDGSKWRSMSALEACCACGGGHDPQSSPTASPTSSPITPLAAGNSASSPAACQGDASTWDAGWGGCSTYVDPSVPGYTGTYTVSTSMHGFCDEDSSGGLLAEQVCSECGQCAPTSPAAGNAASSPAANTAVSATGDPHMQNMLGQRYDLTQPGRHTLLQIPRVASDSDDLLLSVTADAEHEGGACADMYFKALNITGEWASAHQKDGYMYAANAPQMVASWRTFGKVEMKVVWGRSLEDVEYLNLFVRHLKRVGHDIGGLLGMDDYRQAAKVNALCDSTTLLTSVSDETHASRQASFAKAYQ